MLLDLAARALRLLPAETAHRTTLALTGLAAPAAAVGHQRTIRGWR